MIQPVTNIAKQIIRTSALAVVTAIAYVAPSLAADRYALLVGVSAYPTLKEEMQLRGPQNDVVLMRDLLKTQGFAEGNIRVVANGVATANASPTRAIILAELKAVADRAKTGDFVYLQFGGHGSQQPSRPGKVIPEPDGLDEIFLPVDIGPWNGAVGSVQNAIRDDELGAAIDAIRAKGAFVWAVFDACHSGNITRGGSDDETRLRKADPAALGIPQKLLDQAQDDAVVKTRGAPATNAPEKRGALSASQSSSPTMGGYVYFYAAQTTETTPEKPLPAGNPERKPYGVFTYTLAQVITTNPGISYRQASERVLQLYAAQNLRGVTPVFEGSGIDAPLFGQKAGEPIRQWRITTATGGVEIQAGNLHQFGVGAIFAVLPNAASKDTDVVGYLKADKVDVVKSILSPTKYADKAELAMADLPRDAVVRLVNRNVSMTLKVSLPSDRPSKPIYTSALRLLDQLKSATGEGLKIEWVAANQPADARLALADDQLWFVSPDGAWIKTGQNKTPSITLAKKSDEELRAIVMASLQSIGKANNLFKVGSLSGGGTSGLSDKVDAKFFVTRAAGSPNAGKREEISTTQVPTLAPGDRLQLIIRNNHTKPLDVTVLGIDARHGITLLYPASANESNRIHPRDSLPIPGDGQEPIEMNDLTSGRESIVIIAVEAQPNTSAVNLGFLEQPSLDATRGEATVRSSDAGQQSVIDLFQDAAFGGERTRGPARGNATADKTAIRAFNYVSKGAAVKTDAVK